MIIYNSTEKAIKILGGCQNRGSINIYIESNFSICTSYFTSAMSICKTKLLWLKGPEYAYMCVHSLYIWGLKQLQVILKLFYALREIMTHLEFSQPSLSQTYMAWSKLKQRQWDAMQTHYVGTQECLQLYNFMQNYQTIPCLPASA